MITIRICQNNLAQAQLERIQSLAGSSSLRVISEECLGRCSFCEETPYVLIDRQLVYGETENDLLEEIRTILEESTA